MPETCKNCGKELSDTSFMVAADGSKHTRCPVCEAMCDIPAPGEPEPEPDPEPDPDPDPDPDPETEPGAETEPEVEPETEPETEPDSSTRRIGKSRRV